MKFDQRRNHVYFHAGSAFRLLWKTHQRVYLDNSRDDSKNFGKVGHLASLESMSMVHLIS